MDQRRCGWAWLALGLLALCAGGQGAAWDPNEDDGEEANLVPGRQDSRSEWCARVCSAGESKGRGGRCPDPCPPCLPGPPPACPKHVCPSLPTIPACPACPPPACPKPVCPSLPPVPPCPEPRVNLSCPEPRCPATTACPRCPACPPPPPRPLVRPPRPPGYEGWPTAPVGIYKLHKTAASWIAANATCFKEGAHLVIPNTKAEMDVLTKMMKKEKLNFMHAGFHDNHKEGQYLDALGNPMNSEQKSMWDKGQPEGGPRENCANIYDNGLMHDYPCTSKFPFVCEVPY